MSATTTYVDGLAYRVVVTGPRTLTCLHSLALSGQWFLPLAEELGEEYRLVLPDLRGHGASPVGDRPVSLGALADDVVTLWDHLDIADSHVLGISMGGMVAQALAARHPDRVDDLVLIATTASYDEAARAGAQQRADAVREPGGIAAMAGVVLSRWFGEEDDPALAARAREELLSADPQVHAALLEAMTHVGAFRLDENPPATLVLGGTEDTSTPRAVVTALAQAIPGSILDFVPGGHLTAFTHPAASASRIHAFLDRTNGER